MAIETIGPFAPYDSNIYLILGERPIIVDAGTGMASSLVIKEIETILADRKRCEEGTEIQCIVATHCHYDHVGGLADLASRFHCPVYAGTLDSYAIQTGDPKLTVSSLFGKRMAPLDIGVLPLNEGDVLSTGLHDFTILETPGHTPGGICLFEERTGLLISGDTLFSDGYGRTDFAGGSFGQLRESLRRLMELDLKVNIRGLFPGHGNTCSDNVSGRLAGVFEMAGLKNEDN